MTAIILFGLVSNLTLKTCVVTLDIMWKCSLLFVILLPLLHFVTGGLVRRCSTNGEFLLKSGLCEYDTGEYLLRKMQNNSDRVGQVHETFLAAQGLCTHIYKDKCQISSSRSKPVL